MKKVVVLFFVMSFVFIGCKTITPVTYFELIEAYEESGEYDKALELCLELPSQDAGIEYYTTLGGLFEKKHQYLEASEVYKKGLKFHQDTLLIYSLANCQHRLGYYENAKKAYHFYQRLGGEAVLAQRMIASLDSARSWRHEPAEVSTAYLPINTSDDEVSPFFDGQNLMYARRKKSELDPVSKPFRIYGSTKTNQGWGSPKRMKKIGTSDNHQFAPCVNERLGSMYISERSFDTESTIKMLRAKKNEDGWDDLQAFAFNSDDYSVCQAALGFQSRCILFASDMPGGYGGFDLYVAVREGDTWGTPQNLGSEVNTSKDEFYPFVDSRGSLYFCSNGHLTFGGFDIYSVPWENMKVSGKVINLGVGVNSSQDDISFMFDEVAREAYFSSNRKGNFDIYQVKF